MKIYEIDNAIMNCIDIETGEVVDVKQLNELSMERDKKIENVALWVKDLEAYSAAIKEEETRLKRRREIADNKIESLKNFLDYILNGQKKEFPTVTISFRKSEAVQILDKEKIPNEFISEPKTIPGEPMKAEIKKAIKAGNVITGAELVESQKIQIK